MKGPRIMNEGFEINTVLGRRRMDRGVVALSHEHICCYSEYLKRMSKNYLDTEALIERAVGILVEMKRQYGLGLFIDCTPLNIGRNVEVLKQVSQRSGVDIVCSTGFYHNDEPIEDCLSAEGMAEFMLEDVKQVGAGVIKAAVEDEHLSLFNAKLLRASARAQRQSHLPIVLHTNAHNKNALEAVELLMSEGVEPKRLAVGHLSDTEDIGYIKHFADLGCYVALDRLYDNTTEDYVRSKLKQITALCEAGYEDRVLLSHDDSVFAGFSAAPKIGNPRWSYLFDFIIPQLDRKTAEKIVQINPLRMLCGI